MKRIPFTQFRDRVLLYRLALSPGDGMGGRQPGTRKAYFFDGTPSGDETNDIYNNQKEIALELQWQAQNNATPCQVHAPHFWNGAVEGRAGGSITMGITVRLTPNLVKWLKGKSLEEPEAAESALRLVYHGDTYKVLDADYSRKGYVTYTAMKVKLHGA